MGQQQAVEDLLTQLGIPYQRVTHQAVYTMGELDQSQVPFPGIIAKNLFLRDSKGTRHFLVVLAGDKQANLKEIRTLLGTSGLSFASNNRLETHLGLTPGEVTPLGVINDTEHRVEIVFDNELANHPLIGVHPNVNTATLFLSFDNLLAYVAHCGNPVHFLSL